MQGRCNISFREVSSIDTFSASVQTSILFLNQGMVRINMAFS